MHDKIGGFWSTGIWVLLRKALMPTLFVAGFVVMSSPQYRGSAVSTAQAVIGGAADIAHVPGLTAGLTQTTPTDMRSDGGLLFRMGFGRPVVPADTPRVRLSELPLSSTPMIVQLSELPEPSEATVYRLVTQTRQRAPSLRQSPRPAPRPGADGPIQTAQHRLSVGDHAAILLARLGIPMAP